MRPFLSLMAIYEIDICAKLNGGAVRQAPLKLCVCVYLYYGCYSEIV